MIKKPKALSKLLWPMKSWLKQSTVGRCRGIQTRLRLAKYTPQKRFAVVVAMPKAIHLAYSSYQYFHSAYPEIPVMIVMNGLSKKESCYLRQLVSDGICVDIPWGVVVHPWIIDSLIWTSDHNFWLVDHDCLVFKGDPLRTAEKSVDATGAIAACFFGDPTPIHPHIKPHTFLVYVNREPCRKLFKRYNISMEATQWSSLTKKAREALQEMGFRRDLKPHPDNIGQWADTLVTAAMLADHVGVGIQYPERHSAYFCRNDTAIHFGNTSFPVLPGRSANCSTSFGAWRYAALGAFYWRVMLDFIQDFPFTEEYLRAHPSLSDKKRVRESLEVAGCDTEELSFIESLARMPLAQIDF